MTNDLIHEQPQPNALFPEVAPSKEEPLIYSFEQAANAFEWDAWKNYDLHRSDYYGDEEALRNFSNKEWREIQSQFFHDPLVSNMNLWKQIALTENQFLHLVVYDDPSVGALYKENSSRLLVNIALKANNLNPEELEHLYLKATTEYNFPINPLSAPFAQNVYLRETLPNSSESSEDGFAYLHDGNRRLINYARKIVSGEKQYTPISALFGAKVENPHDTALPISEKPKFIVGGYKDRKSVPQEEILDTFINAEQVYFVLPEKIGDIVMSTGFLRGVLELEQQMGIQIKENIIMAPISMHSLLKPTCEKYGLKLIQANAGTGSNKAEYEAREIAHKTAIVFDLDAEGGGNPEGLYFEHGCLTIKNMLPSIVERYGVSDAGLNKHINYLRDLFGVNPDTLNPLLIQPCLELQDGAEQKKQELVSKYSIDTTKPQVSIIIETSEPGRQYDINKWIEAARLIQGYYPDTEFNIIYDPKKNAQDETFIPRDQLTTSFSELKRFGNGTVRLIGEPLIDIVQLMPTQNVVLANDTGLPHLIATSKLKSMPNVVTLFAAPHANPDNWVTSPRMKPVTPPQSELNKEGGIYCADPQKNGSIKLHLGQ
ncbi:hypothetical protein HGA88_06345 [Candidatus Roizmanbacteria bacterium]|nr:hypothetical protein [Candidatus Roizmanbacteria bacterium]